MDYGFDRILNEYGDKYEVFIIMDADNLGFSKLLKDYESGFL